jgi:hypothetical protein
LSQYGRRERDKKKSRQELAHNGRY